MRSNGLGSSACGFIPWRTGSQLIWFDFLTPLTVQCKHTGTCTESNLRVQQIPSYTHGNQVVLCVPHDWIYDSHKSCGTWVVCDEMEVRKHMPVVGRCTKWRCEARGFGFCFSLWEGKEPGKVKCCTEYPEFRFIALIRDPKITTWMVFKWSNESEVQFSSVNRFGGVEGRWTWQLSKKYLLFTRSHTCSTKLHCKYFQFTLTVISPLGAGVGCIWTLDWIR